MARIWRIHEGRNLTLEWPWGVRLPMSEAIALFELRRSDFKSGLKRPPSFGVWGRDIADAGFKHIVVEIEHDEGRKAKWKPGFYKSRIKPQEAFGTLIHQAIASKLGKDNVVRVDWEPAVNSLGEDAVSITIVIAPKALKKLKDGAVLDVLSAVNERLREMRDDRTPIVHYATEAELAENAGS